MFYAVASQPCDSTKLLHLMPKTHIRHVVKTHIFTICYLYSIQTACTQPKNNITIHILKYY
jgi:hypothetical protein